MNKSLSTTFYNIQSRNLHVAIPDALGGLHIHIYNEKNATDIELCIGFHPNGNIIYIYEYKKSIVKQYYDKSDGHLYLKKYTTHGDIVHNTEGPAIITYDADGNIHVATYVEYSKSHRDNGPAYITYYPNGKIKKEIWYKNGMRHREIGPAKIQYDQTGKIIEVDFFIQESWLPYEDFFARPEYQAYLKREVVDLFD